MIMSDVLMPSNESVFLPLQRPSGARPTLIAEFLSYQESIKLLLVNFWYAKWDLSTVVRMSPSLLQALSRVGASFYILKILSVIINLFLNCQQSSYMTLQGITKTKRRMIKASFDLLETGLSVATGLIYFIFHLACAPYLFIASSAFAVLRSSYSLIKNVMGYRNCREKKRAPNSTHAETTQFALFSTHYQHKIQRSLCDVIAAISSLVFMCFFVPCPAIAVLGLAVTGIAYFFARRHFTQKCKKSKTALRATLSNHPPGLFNTRGPMPINVAESPSLVVGQDVRPSTTCVQHSRP